MLLSPFRDLELGSEQAPHRRDFRLERNAVVSADVPIADKARRKHEGNHGQLCIALGNHRDCQPAVKRKGSYFETQTLGRVLQISDLWVVKEHGTSQLRDRKRLPANGGHLFLARFSRVKMQSATEWPDMTQSE